MHAVQRHPAVFWAQDKLAGLGFEAAEGWCLFRADCEGFEFNHPLDPANSYAVIDVETNVVIGIYSPGGFTGPMGEEFHPYKVYLLRPMLEDCHS